MSSGPKAQPAPDAPGASAQTRSAALQRSGAVWSGAFGLLLGLALVKFGNPVILDHLVYPPQTPVEWLLGPWRVAFAYLALAAVGAGAVVLGYALTRTTAGPAAGRHAGSRAVCATPLLWLTWTAISALAAREQAATWIVFPQLCAATACFYLGYKLLARLGRAADWLWPGVIAGFAWMLLAGFEQHYGGLEASRRMLLESPGSASLPPDFLKRLQGGRVFATLFYANALAGVILLLLPPLLAVAWPSPRSRTSMLRAVVAGTLAYSGLACLFWSGSKAGWLIAAIQVAVAGLWLPTSRRVKCLGIAALLLVAGGVFALRFQGYFERGATSASARLDYWRAAADVMLDHPLAGSGPGSFAQQYTRLKRPDAEMTRLVHNDYLQQGSDSGIPALLLYAAVWLGGLWVTGANLARRPVVERAIWLGLLGWTLQSGVEFGLYIPALGWIAFTLLGWLIGRPTVHDGY